MYDMRKREVEVSGACLLPPMYMRVYASRLIANGCDAALTAGSARLRSPRGFAFRVPGCCMCTAAAQETRRDLARFRVASRRVASSRFREGTRRDDNYRHVSLFRRDSAKSSQAVDKFDSI